jgi:deoxyuridine 5'-triphosphate nucleotidohydrolase
MIHFSCKPEPTLTILGERYTGISMLEALDLVRLYPEQYPGVSQYDVDQHFQHLALYFQQPMVPTLGFKLCDDLAVLPSKRIIDVGFDLTITGVSKMISNKITLFETGVALDIPPGYYVELLPRSSISKTGYMLANSVGVIDPGYTGSVKVPLIKIDESMPDLELPVRIAQLILKPYVVAHSRTTQNLQATSRGSGGFGSTNVECTTTCDLIANETNNLCSRWSPGTAVANKALVLECTTTCDLIANETNGLCSHQ